MAIVQLQRAWYRPKLPVIHYVTNQRVLLRARPAKVRNPRTKAQQANRSKMAIASRFLSQLQDFVAHGFQPGERPNGRPVGAYHVALGHLLSRGMRHENGQWRIDYKHVRLAEGQQLSGYPVSVRRDGRTLSLAWPEGFPEGTHRIRLAFHNAKRGESQSLEVHVPKKGEAIEVLLPKWAKAGALHLWWCPVARGTTRWQSKYLLLPKGEGYVVGWAFGGKRLGGGKPARVRGKAAGAAFVNGANSRSARAVGGLGGG